MQIICTKELAEKENLWLKSLKKGLEVRSMSAILEKREKGLPGMFPEAYFEILLKANPKTFLEAYNMRAATFEEVFTEAGIIPQWIERGIEQEKVRTAKNLLAKRMPIEEIAQVTELPVEKIRTLAS